MRRLDKGYFIYMNLNAYISVYILFLYLTNSQDMQCKCEKSVRNNVKLVYLNHHQRGLLSVKGLTHFKHVSIYVYWFLYAF